MDVEGLETEAQSAIASASSLDELDDVRVRFLGRKSELKQALRGVRDRETGMALNAVRERLEQAVAEREAELERFAATTIELQELERRRVAAEIHDGISQRLVSLWYHLLAAEDAVADPDLLRRELGVAKELTTAALDDTRAAILGLRPTVLDDLGLGPGLESLARSVMGPAVEVEVAPERLPPHVEVALFRIAQEALQNVVKHAEASLVRVSLLPVADGVRLAVDDDGKGITHDRLDGAEERHSYGMVGIRERAELIGAALDVVSRPGTGTTVEVVVPSGQPQKS